MTNSTSNSTQSAPDRCDTFTWCTGDHSSDVDGAVTHRSADVDLLGDHARLVAITGGGDPDDVEPVIITSTAQWTLDEAASVSGEFWAALHSLLTAARVPDRSEILAIVMLEELHERMGGDGLGKCPPWCVGSHDDLADGRHHYFEVGEVRLTEPCGARSTSTEPVAVSVWANSFGDDANAPESAAVIDLRIGGETADLEESHEWLTADEAVKLAALLLTASKTIRTGRPHR